MPDANTKADSENSSGGQAETLRPGFLYFMLGVPLVVAIVIAVLSGYIVFTAEGEGLNEAATFSIVLASITLNIALATLIPYFISDSKIKNESERAARVEVSGLESRILDTGTDLDELRKSYNSDIELLEKRISGNRDLGQEDNWSVDAHLSRMVAYFLYKERDFMWSIGWAARSLKRYIKLIEHDRREYAKYAEFFVFNLKVIEQSVYEIVAEAKKGQSPELSLEASIRAVMKKNIVANQSHVFEQGGRYRPVLRAFKDVLDALIEIDRPRPRPADGQEERIIDYECFDGMRVHRDVGNLRIVAPLLVKISLKTDPSYKELKETQLDAFISDVKGISSHKDDVETRVRAYADAETFEDQLERFYARVQEEVNDLEV